MKSIRRAAVLAASLSLAFAAPALAQNENPLQGGEWVEVGMITVDDGHYLDYANHLATKWRRSQDFAKAQGWITGYEILMNPHARKGEPDVYLLTRFTSFANPAEEDRRDAAFRAHMQATEAQLQADSGERAKYRHLSGTTLLRQLNFRK